MKILIRGGRVIDPANGIDEVLDVYIEDGKIINVGKDLKIQVSLSSNERGSIIDAKKMWVTPGLIDMHVHLREPGFKHKETIKTGTRSAAIGGFTTICPMANTNPVTDNEIVVEYIKNKAEKEGIVNVVPVGSITKNLKGEELSAIGGMAQAGICAISDDGLSVDNPLLLRTAMKYASMFNLPILSHCEDIRLTGQGQINAGAHAQQMGFKGITNDSEEIIVARDIILARATKAHLHIMHVSARQSLIHIKAAKDKGIKVTAEVCPHHFTIIDEDIVEYDANFKMSPPLRGKKDREALLQALRDGTIDVIATDHAPHHIDEKNCEFEKAANGIVGLETALPLCITQLIEKKVLTPLQLIEKLTINPANILNLNKGTLSPGAVADVTVIDPTYEHTIDKNTFESKSKNTPFNGRVVRGKCMHLIVGGKQVVKDGAIWQ